jgi:Cu/Ag efflux protein CusF
MRVITTINALLLGAGLIGTAPLIAQAQTAPNTRTVVAVAPGKAMAGASANATATVIGVDAATRVVTLKGADGKVFDITCGDEVKNFAQIKVGDLVHAQYTMGLSLELRKAGSKGTEHKGAAPVEEHGVASAALGSKPAGAMTRKVSALADVIAVDEKNHVVSLRGPRGNEVDLDVQDPEQLKNIKKGDHVQVVYTEALAVVVESAPTPAQ